MIVYAHDVAALARHDRARNVVEQLWRDRSGVLSTQVLQELYVRLRKTRNPLPPAEARQILVDYLRWEIVVNTGDGSCGSRS